MLDFGNPKYLFKCSDCQMIVAVDLEDDADLKKWHDDTLHYLCQCGGACLPLRD